jgi:hypothetical protein
MSAELRVCRPLSYQGITIDISAEVSLPKVRLELAREEARDSELGRGLEVRHEDISPAVWIAMGIELEELQYVTDALLCCWC